MNIRLKTLAIYSGQTRSHRHVWANHILHLWRHFSDLTIVASVASDENAKDMTCISKALPKVPFIWEAVEQPQDFPDIPEPKCHFHAAYGPSVTPDKIMRQLWALNHAWDFANKNVDITNYDLVIRVRPDSAFLRVVFPLEIGGTSLNKWVCFTPWFERWGGVCDRFALMGVRAAEAYFTTYEQRQAIWDSWVPVHPESMVHEALARIGITPDDTLEAEFLTTRLPDAQHATPWFSLLTATQIDVANFARSMR